MKLVYFSIYLIFVKIHEILKQILQKDWFCMKEWIITIIQIYRSFFKMLNVTAVVGRLVADPQLALTTPNGIP